MVCEKRHNRQKVLNVKYSYAKDSAGEIIHISVAEKSKDYFCLVCQEKMLFKAGNVKTKHFAHSPNSECSGESYLHYLAKHRFCERFNDVNTQEVPLLLPIEAVCQEYNVCKFYTQALCSTEIEGSPINLKRYYSEAILEKSYTKNGKNYIADILLKRPEGVSNTDKPFFIEIYKTHACDEHKRNSGIPIVEFIIEDEQDIDNMIKHPIAASKKVLFWNLKRKERQLYSPNNFGVKLHTAGLNNQGEFRYTEYHSCSRLRYFTGRLNITLKDKGIVSKIGEYIPLLCIGATLCIKQNSSFKNCCLCKHQVKNDYYGYICRCYKRAGLQRLCKDNNPYNCGYFTPDIERIIRYSEALEEYLKNNPHWIR